MKLKVKQNLISAWLVICLLMATGEPAEGSWITEGGWAAFVLVNFMGVAICANKLERKKK